MSVMDPWYEARELMVRALEDDLLGRDDEVLTEPPLDRFIMGVLHPQSAQPVEDAAVLPEDAEAGDGGVEVDAGVSFAHARYPSSMGMTLAVDCERTRSVSLEFTATRYFEESEAEAADREAMAAEEARQEGEVESGRSDRRPRWSADHLAPAPTSVEVADAASNHVQLAPGLEARILVRPARRGVVRVTVTLVNTARRPVKGRADALAWFRPRIVARADQGELIAGADVASSTAVARSEDEASGDLLYRDVVSLGIGHGCAVDWQDTETVTELSTTFLPRQVVPSAKAERTDLPLLSMRVLSGDVVANLGLLEALVVRYREWIGERRAQLTQLESNLLDTATRHLEAAESAAGRMQAGIDLLRDDPVAAEAFRVMNSAMFAQRARQEMIRSGAEEPSSEDQQWRPFQLGFILLNLVGLADEDSDERDIADVLWFPTGGGKTEAYLGLIAFIVCLRRLRDPEGGGGVAVIMRYTLRLLTVQQFERATALICALELWRRGAAPRSAPISVGLWVGQATTPNDVQEAARVLRGGRGGEGTPRQLLKCPWCGHSLPIDAYVADRVKDRLTVSCTNDRCDFRDGLPVHLIDSDVYNSRPSLVIGTVDKFAMIPLKEKAATLFGGDGMLSPDLIIQDELHLISGPLGTLVGLYETAVDALMHDGSRPKFVASTATIRRAGEQVRKVFDRKASQFPPPGIDAVDSFFSVQATAEEKADRLYVGLMAPGTSHATLMVRTYAALLQAAFTLDADEAVKDAYWTILGYFSSLRVLGSAFMQSVDDVPDRLRVVASRAGTKQRRIDPPREMTSRKRADEIPEELEILGTPYPHPDSPDIVLATNMISVGVDVDRLGLMAVMGQPQTTSEYIQATSRVGRRHPGLVVAILNASRSRDISHYEHFAAYHRALYRHVEATGATPFAARAVDRGLHGVLVALLRHTVEGAGADGEVATAFADPSEIERVKEVILRRVDSVEPGERDRVEEALDALIEQARVSIDLDQTRKYMSWGKGSDSLMKAAGGELVFDSEADPESVSYFPVQEPAWPTLTSLRNVDSESSLYLVRARRNRGDD